MIRHYALAGPGTKKGGLAVSTVRTDPENNFSHFPLVLCTRYNVPMWYDVPDARNGQDG